MIALIMDALMSVQKVYLKYPTVSGKHINQERVFAYEFYHQLRCALEKNHKNLFVSGENKKGVAVAGVGNEHPIFPDLIIHEFGSHASNTIAIELKTSPKIKASEIERDLDKLIYLTKAPYNYTEVLFLALNCDLSEKINNSRKYRDRILNKMENCNQLTVWNFLPLNSTQNLTRETLKDVDVFEIEVIPI